MAAGRRQRILACYRARVDALPKTRTSPRKRCRWVPADDRGYARYHDREWGRPVRRDRRLFELLILEGAQAGLSWATILRKRAHYRRAFADFDLRRVARFGLRRQAQLLRDPGIVRNRLKVAAAVGNARAFLAVQREFGSLSRYLWAFAGGLPRVNRPRRGSIAPRSPLSDALSQDLRRRGFRFVGSTITYAFLQACGVVNDHERGCFLCPPPARPRPSGQVPVAARPAPS